MNTTNLLVQQLLNGVAIGSVYAIFALGYTLIFSILRIINFAHGAVFTLGAYFTYALIGSKFGINGLLKETQLPFALPFPAAMIVGGIAAGVIGIIIEFAAFRPLRNKGADPLLTLVASLGVAIAIVNFIQYLVGAEIYSYPGNSFSLAWEQVFNQKLPPAINFGWPGFPLPVRTIQIAIFVVSMLIVVGLTYLINATKVGKALRAVSEDAVTASLLGISTDRLILFTFFLSGFLGGVAGTLVGLSVSINGPYFGIAFGLKGLAVIVLGGLGDIPGAVVGGFVIGIAEAVLPVLAELLLPASTYLAPGTQWIAYKDAIAFAILFIILMVRPQGLLGRTVVQKV
jgi:branched-chain amino acid transport system permease protein